MDRDFNFNPTLSPAAAAAAYVAGGALSVRAAQRATASIMDSREMIALERLRRQQQQQHDDPATLAMTTGDVGDAAAAAASNIRTNDGDGAAAAASGPTGSSSAAAASSSGGNDGGRRNGGTDGGASSSGGGNSGGDDAGGNNAGIAESCGGGDRKPPPESLGGGPPPDDGVNEEGDDNEEEKEEEEEGGRLGGHHPDLPFLVTHWIAQFGSAVVPGGKKMIAAEGIVEEGGGKGGGDDEEGKRRREEEALRRIRDAASTLAEAFESLGAYGPSSRCSATTPRSAAYADLKRMYSPLLLAPPPSASTAGRNGAVATAGTATLLDALVCAETAAHVASSTREFASVRPWSLLEAAREGTVPAAATAGAADDASAGSNQRRAGGSPGRRGRKSSAAVAALPSGSAGRTVGGAGVGADGTHSSSVERLVPAVGTSGSAMMRFPRLTTPPVVSGTEGASTAAPAGAAVADLDGDDVAAAAAARASRERIARRIVASTRRATLEGASRSLDVARARREGIGSTVASVAARRAGGGDSAVSGGTAMTSSFDPDSDLDRHRVVSQLERRVSELAAGYEATVSEVAKAERKFRNNLDLAGVRERRGYGGGGGRESASSYSIQGRILQRGGARRNLGHGPKAHASGKNNFVLDAVLARQYRCNRCCHQSMSTSLDETELSILKSRLSHAATISCHLVYPIYCLKFDRTGRYFITGADDQVVKLFHLGAGSRRQGASHNDDGGDCATEGTGGALDEDGRRPAFTYGANARGAVLVCTLRGHAGVVSDIDVSANNALLATASGDGDVRVWGLKDGVPIAILRGHKDGANMVSWSTLSPFRLVSCGEDGLARMWDVRDAARKRYGDHIDNLSYCSWPEGEEAEAESSNKDADVPREQVDQAHQQIALPPNPLVPPHLPAAAGERGALPNNPAAPAIGFGGVINVAAESPYGAFVANNLLDDGVKLIAQMQHGALFEDGQRGLQGRVTRTAAKAVKVMCIARCPLGGHFATGSDDGLGHIWADDDDWHVESLDRKFNDFTTGDVRDNTSCSVQTHLKAKAKVSNAPSKERLLATLHQHEKAVTDLKYSHAGDRLLTGSMKEGVVCIWTLGEEGAMTSLGRRRFPNMSQLVIQLHHPSQSETAANCDGVAWTCDDMKIVTSQSSPLKATGTEILPDSHMIYVWDSDSGRCLMGIMSSHESLSSALAPHPTLPSVIASAGSDGVVNVWDLDRGDCFYTHTNILKHGPVEPATNRGKRCAYLEVQFSPDGLTLVLTDEGGRVTMLDTQAPARLRSGTPASAMERTFMEPWSFSTPLWMGDQYFASDYYELLYDQNGYCIERGSEQPAHLAPRGVRCTYEGVGHSEMIRATYGQLEGPLPLPENHARWDRDDMRYRLAQFRAENISGAKNIHRRAKRVVRNTELFWGLESTAVITKGGNLVQQRQRDSSAARPSAGGQGSRNSNNSSRSNVRQLSDRYQWSNAHEEPDTDDDEDQDDGEYGGSGRRVDESEDDDEELVLGSQSSRRRSAGQGGGRPRNNRNDDNFASAVPQEQQQPSRVSSRQNAQRQYLELDSDDEQLNEQMSTHVEPSGEFVEDWTVSKHVWKLPRGAGGKLSREWLSRQEYAADSAGRKVFCPQVGDSVVYIPRAHQEILSKYPVQGVLEPWQTFPTDSPWSVVRCKVTHIRYRFPYQTYYRSRNSDEKLTGIAAILSLEVTGLPSQTTDRTLPWPAPTFTASPANTIEFEVTLFDCGEGDFIIPEHLYLWRVREMEKAIAANGGDADGVSVTVYVPNDGIEFEPYNGTLVAINERNEEEFHFVDSGYNALTMEWDTADDGGAQEFSIYSVWEFDVKNPSSERPFAPKMAVDVKRDIERAFRSIMSYDQSVEDWFFRLVDTSVYTDYEDMIEVPMYLSLIQKRLRSNYYTNKLSVLSDVDVMKQNCYKYNEDNNEFFDLASQVHAEFKRLLDAIEEPQAIVEEEPYQPPQITNVAARRNQRHALRSESTEEDGTTLESPATDDAQEGRRTRALARAQNKSNDDSDEEGRSEEDNPADDPGSMADSNEENEPRRTSRRSASQRPKSSLRARNNARYSYAELDSVEQPESPESSVSPQTNRRGRSARNMKPNSYLEKDSDDEEFMQSSSDEDDSDEESSSEEEEVRNRKRKQTGSGSQRKKRSRTGNQKTNSFSEPESPEWPSISKRKIRQVGVVILNKLRDLDDQELFAQPVCEVYPDMTADYLKKIKTPMDFQTIEDECLDTYDEIAQMQDDLALTFRNCCHYNGAESEFGLIAIDLWKRLDGVFREACREQGIRLASKRF